ncbi:beta strand repeat-containing protein [Mesorhizobium sp. ORM6]
MADASHAVKLPANVSIDNIKVDGHNLVLEQADGSVIVIKDGALNVPTFIIGDVEVPRVALIAALEASHVDVAFGADGSMSAGPGGSTSSAGGNFEIPAGGIGDGFGLSALLPPTDLQFGLLEHRELFPGLVEKDSTISLTGTPPTLNVDESYLPDGSHTGPGSTTDTLSFANIFTVVPGSGTPTVSYALSVTTQGETSNLIDSATGQTVVLVLNGNTVEGHVGDAGGALVFTMSVNTATGAVILTQDRAVHQDDLSNTPDDAISLASNLVKLTATVTDPGGHTASASADIGGSASFHDDGPTANADTNGVAAGSHAEISGNVITGAGEAAGDADVKGADGASVTSASGVNAAQAVTAGGTTIQGAYGALTLHADGSYTYDRGTNTPGGVTDTFHYTLTDGDGDTSSSTLKIAIGQGTPELGPIPAEGSAGAIVYEAGLATIGSQAGNPSDPVTASGDIAFTSQDGVQKVMLGTHQLGEGVANAVTFTDPAAGGTVSAYYTYDGTSGGTIHYSYTLTAPYPSATAGDGTNIEATPNFAVVVTDLDNQTASGTLTIDVKDDTPTANADTNSVAAGSHAEITGNVITGAGEAAGDADVKGADGASVTSASGVNAAQTVTAGGTTIQGAYGVLTLHADGSYTYDRGTNTPGGVTDTFHYTLTDGDGDTSSTTLKIAIGQGTPELGPIPAEGSAGAIVYEAGLATIGSQAGNPSDPVTASGDIAFTSQDGVQKVMLGTHQLGEGVANAVTFTDPAAGGTVSAYYTYDGTSGGTIHYSYTLTAPYPSATAGDGTNIEATPNFAVVVTDLDNQTASGTLTIDVKDDTPTANADTNSVAAGSHAEITGNVITGAGEAAGDADVKGADGASVTSASGVDAAQTVTAGGTTIQGAYGVLTLHADGSYTYDRGTNTPGGVTDTFHYTLTDGDGDTSSTTLKIAIGQGTPELGPIPAEGSAGAIVYEAGLATIGSQAGNPSDPVTASGDIAFTSQDGVQKVMLGTHQLGEGVANAVTFTDPAAGGTVSAYYTYDGTSGGTIHYSYTLTAPYPSATAGDGTNIEATPNFDIAVTDMDNQTVTGNLTIDVIDDTPTAAPDTNSLTSGQTVTSNVESNDVFGADGKSGGVNGGVVGVATGTNTATALSTGVGAALTGSLGTLTLQANGSYSYVANPNVSGTDHFVYTIKDGDGNTSTTTLNITVNASGLAAGPDTVTVNEAGLASGSLHDGSNVTPSGTTLVGLVSGGVGADTYSLVGSATGTHGTIVINSDGTFTYTLTSPILAGTPTELADTFTYQVKDSVGNTITNTITVNALDDHPTATPDTNSLTSGQTVTSNVESNDVFGADGKSGGVNGGVVGVATGTDTATALSTGVGAALTGSSAR